MRGHYGRRAQVGAEAAVASASQSTSLPTALLIMGGVVALVASVLRDEARAGR